MILKYFNDSREVSASVNGQYRPLGPVRGRRPDQEARHIIFIWPASRTLTRYHVSICIGTSKSRESDGYGQSLQVCEEAAKGEVQEMSRKIDAAASVPAKQRNYHNDSFPVHTNTMI